MPDSKAKNGEDLALMEFCADIVREHVKGFYSLLPDRLYHTLSRMTSPGYQASHFYTVALAVARLPAEEAGAILEALEEVFEDGRKGPPLPIREALSKEGHEDGAEDIEQQDLSLDPDDEQACRRYLTAQRRQRVAGREVSRSVVHHLRSLRARKLEQGRKPAHRARSQRAAAGAA